MNTKQSYKIHSIVQLLNDTRVRIDAIYYYQRQLEEQKIKPEFEAETKDGINISLDGAIRYTENTLKELYELKKTLQM